MRPSAITLASDISAGNLDCVTNVPMTVLLLVQQSVDSSLVLGTEVYRGFPRSSTSLPIYYSVVMLFYAIESSVA